MKVNKRLAAFLAPLMGHFLGSCSWFDSAIPDYQQLAATPYDIVGPAMPEGTVRESDLWNCIADGSGKWSCRGLAGALEGYQLVADAAPGAERSAEQRELEVHRKLDKLRALAANAQIDWSDETWRSQDSEPAGTLDQEIAAADLAPGGNTTAAIDVSPREHTPVTAFGKPVSSDLPIDRNQYVLQLAAYRSLSGARNRLQAMDLPDSGIYTLPGGGNFFLILAGQYDSPNQARVAGDALQNSGASSGYWVRGGSELMRPVSLATTANPLEKMDEDPLIAAINAPAQSASPAPTGTVAAAAEYFVQLAMYKSLEGAQDRLQRMNIPGAEIRTVSGISGERHLILAGGYASKTIARDAVETLKDRIPDLDYWIRRDISTDPLRTSSR
ncbi:MAG: SPOR domain-containing protein [Halieaceae bacterium]|jgi:septal ring-binding cell division protein DamX|nr:SPOR domain-containing protein [Halieaceae bacterium]